mgnify:CR=1 FL=1
MTRQHSTLRFPAEEYLNRELSMLAFNRRVLAQAQDERVRQVGVGLQVRGEFAPGLAPVAKPGVHGGFFRDHGDSVTAARWRRALV